MASLLLAICVLALVSGISGSVVGASQLLQSKKKDHFVHQLITEGGRKKKNAPSFILPLTLQARKQVKGGRHLLESFTTITVGTPPQPIPVFFDTGSYFPLIYGAQCTEVGCGPAVKYNATASTTAIVSNIPAVANYGAGKGYGVWAQDYIKLSGSGVFVKFAQNFTLLHEVKWRPSENMGVWSGSGILGLGPAQGFGERSRNTKMKFGGVGEEEEVANVIYEPTTDTLAYFGYEMFAVKVERGMNGDFTSRGGKVQIGGYDQLLPRSSDSSSTSAPPGPVWAPVPPTLGWLIYLDDVRVNGVSTGVCNASPKACECLFDTGGAVMDMQTAGLPSNVPAFFNCSDTHVTDKLPNISIVITNTSFTFEPRDYVLKLPDGTCQNTIAMSFDGEAATESSSVRGGGHAFLDLGIMFQARVLTIFDFINLRIGFIQHD